MILASLWSKEADIDRIRPKADRRRPIAEIPFLGLRKTVSRPSAIGLRPSADEDDLK